MQLLNTLRNICIVRISKPPWIEVFVFRIFRVFVFKYCSKLTPRLVYNLIYACMHTMLLVHSKFYSVLAVCKKGARSFSEDSKMDRFCGNIDFDFDLFLCKI